MIGFSATKMKDSLLLQLRLVFSRFGISMKDLNLLINILSAVRIIFKLAPSLPWVFLVAASKLTQMLLMLFWLIS